MRREGDAHPVLGLGVLDARLHSGTILLYPQRNLLGLELDELARTWAAYRYLSGHKVSIAGSTKPNINCGRRSARRRYRRLHPA